MSDAVYKNVDLCFHQSRSGKCSLGLSWAYQKPGKGDLVIPLGIEVRVRTLSSWGMFPRDYLAQLITLSPIAPMGDLTLSQYLETEQPDNRLWRYIHHVLGETYSLQPGTPISLRPLHRGKLRAFLTSERAF